MPIICSIINNAALVYGGITDYKRREIPNMVPVVLLATGIFVGGFILQRFIIMLIVAFILWLTTKITKQELPGGDFKLICALTFSSGLIRLLMTLFAAIVGALLVALIKKERIRRNVPLCTYVAPAYLLTSAAFLFLF